MTFCKHSLTALATVTVLAGCGGGGGAAPRATVTDEGCTYEGTKTFAPGLFSLEVENESSRFTTFSLWGLRTGSSAADLEQLYASRNGQLLFPAADANRILAEPASSTDVEPGGTSNLPANESTGRYVVVCVVHEASDTRQASQAFVPPDALYAAAELHVGEGGG